jgi:hypothetical protein
MAFKRNEKCPCCFQAGISCYFQCCFCYLLASVAVASLILSKGKAYKTIHRNYACIQPEFSACGRTQPTKSTSNIDMSVIYT